MLLFERQQSAEVFAGGDGDLEETGAGGLEETGAFPSGRHSLETRDSLDLLAGEEPRSTPESRFLRNGGT